MDSLAAEIQELSHVGQPLAQIRQLREQGLAQLINILTTPSLYDLLEGLKHTTSEDRYFVEKSVGNTQYNVWMDECHEFAGEDSKYGAGKELKLEYNRKSPNVVKVRLGRRDVPPRVLMTNSEKKIVAIEPNSKRIGSHCHIPAHYLDDSAAYEFALEHFERIHTTLRSAIFKSKKGIEMYLAKGVNAAGESRVQQLDGDVDALKRAYALLQNEN